MNELFIGFDSAWVNQNPGAIAAYMLDGQGDCRFDAPALATFEDAADFINREAARPARVAPDELREFLVRCARSGSTIKYGDVAAEFEFPWSQGFGASLTRALNILAVENKRCNEPVLMCLVVNKSTGLPGQGYYAAIGQAKADPQSQRHIFLDEVRRCTAWPWKEHER